MDRWQNRVAVCVGISDTKVSEKIVKILVDNSLRVAICDSEENLAKIDAKGLKKVPTDLGNAEDVKNAFTSVQQEFGQVNKTEHSFHHYPLAMAIVSYCAMT